MVFHGYLLHPKVLLSRNGKPGSGFYCLVIGYDDTLPAADITNARNRPARGASSLFLIHLIARKSPDLYKWPAFIRQVGDTLTGRELVLIPLLFDGLFSTAQ